HCNLGDVLKSRGCFAESLAAYRRGHELGSRRADWGYPSGQWVRDAERLATLEGQLTAWLQGGFQPRSTAESPGLAAGPKAKRLYAATARLCADAFAADPRLAGLQTVLRYQAVSAAALAAAGQGEDAGKLGGSERRALRRQALTWLRADLAAWSRLFAEGEV